MNDASTSKYEIIDFVFLRISLHADAYQTLDVLCLDMR